MRKMLHVCLFVAVTISGVPARHVYPFHYSGSMPEMVHMVDDPRQVGVEETLIEPPRYGGKLRDLKTHDFYPHDPRTSGDSSFTANGDVRSRVTYPDNFDSTAPGNVLQPAPLPAYPGAIDAQSQYVPQLPQFYPGNVALPQGHAQIPSQTHTQLVFPQQQVQSRLQCFAVGTLRNEAMDAWCVANCNHTPSYCPPNYCSCGAYKKKK